MWGVFCIWTTLSDGTGGYLTEQVGNVRLGDGEVVPLHSQKDGGLSDPLQCLRADTIEGKARD